MQRGGGGVLRDPERDTKRRARELRGRMTDAEIVLWSRLRRLALGGHRFRRQHPIGPFVADFACIQEGLVVEIDGATHGTDLEIAHDRRREAYLRKRGWRVVRFSNEDVYRRLDEVLDAICRYAPPPAASRRPPP